MNEQHRQVQVWLDKVFGHEDVPQYEINQQTISILHDLMRKSEQQEKLARMRIEDLTQKSEEYHVEADRLAGILKEVGLTASVLSQSGISSLKTLASVAALLQVKSASNTSLMLALGQIKREGLKLQDASRAELKLTTSLQSKTKAALLKYSQLKKALERLEEQDKMMMPELAKKSKQTVFYQSKLVEYDKHLHSYQIELERNGADSSIYHHTLVKQSEYLKQLKEKLHPLKSKLDSCQKLPPDISLVKVKVEEAKRQLADLESELSKHIDLMHI